MQPQTPAARRIKGVCDWEFSQWDQTGLSHSFWSALLMWELGWYDFKDVEEYMGRTTALYVRAMIQHRNKCREEASLNG